MSDKVSKDYPTREITRATTATGKPMMIRTINLTPPNDYKGYPTKKTSSEADASRPWSNYNRTKDEERVGCSSATGLSKAVSIISDDSAQVLQEMSYVGGMNYARTRLQEAVAFRASGKWKESLQIQLNLKQYSLTEPYMKPL